STSRLTLHDALPISLRWRQGRSGLKRKASGVAHGDGQCAFLHDAGSKVSAVAEGHGFAHDANVVAGMQLKVAGLEHLGVADMDIRLSRAGLDSEVRSDGRNGRIGFVF